MKLFLMRLKKSIRDNTLNLLLALNKPITGVLLVLAILIAFALSQEISASDSMGDLNNEIELTEKQIKKALRKIHRTSNYFYMPNRRVGNLRANKGMHIPDLFVVLPYNSVASCSNYTAKSIELVREELGMKAVVLSFYVTTGYGSRDPMNNLTYHAAAGVPYKGGYWILDSLKKSPYYVDKLDPKTKITSLEFEQQRWASYNRR